MILNKEQIDETTRTHACVPDSLSRPGNNHKQLSAFAKESRVLVILCLKQADARSFASVMLADFTCFDVIRAKAQSFQTISHACLKEMN